VNKWGGAERVLLTLHELFPNASLFTSVYSQRGAPWANVFKNIYTSFIQRVGLLREKHELLASLMPIAFESLDFKKYDLVISVTSEAAKGILTGPNTLHICYCLTPTRYLWSGYNEYFKGQTFKVLTRPIIRYLRKWDKIAAQRPDIMIAISTCVQKRIKNYYGRTSKIIFPPVDLEKFTIYNQPYRQLRSQFANNKKENYYLVVSRLVSYKRVDLVIRSFNKLERKLVIIGAGNDEKRLKSLSHSNIKFIGQLTDEELTRYYRKCAALIFPQEEDFGLVAVEAQACGAPVIAYKAGGAFDTVIEGKTGVFFENQSEGSLTKAINRFEKTKFEKRNCVQNVRKFSKKRFKKEFLKLINEYY
jgi:glycosyltransferase involved in cell wall biosynthesis